MIVGKQVCKSFDGFMALDHTNFHVKKGSVYGLVGPNGAGKSTLLRNIMGIFRPDSGHILVDGQDVYENTDVKAKMAFIPDAIFYHRQASILDMKKFYQGIYPQFDEEMFASIQSCFPECDLNKQIQRMSKGMQKQAAFMLSICLRPEVLVLDEPVDGLDPVMRRQIWNLLLNSVSQDEMTVVVSSHNLRELEDVCDYVGIMNHGKLLIEQSLTEVQGSIVKVQVAYEDGYDLPQLSEGCQLLKSSSTGKLHSLIIRGDQAQIEADLHQKGTLLLEFLPLSLEEIFIYELGGEHYEVKDIIL